MVLRQGWFFLYDGLRACGVGQFFLLVKRLALRAGQRQSWFFFELVLAPVARGMFFPTVKWLALRAGQK